jgi:release factor glutamine methyltransferase
MKALDKLRVTRELLKSFGITDAEREAEIIVSHCLGTDRVILYRDNPLIHEEADSKIDEYLKRRSLREPLQYILGYTGFYGLRIKTGRGVLIPRPETELLAEAAIKILRGQQKTSATSRILDLCTGTGCIALALANAFPDAKVYGTDISEKALQFAQENADMNRIQNVTFLKGNLFDPVKKNLRFDLIISNPPYIESGSIQDLEPEIKDWEPLEALDGGDDGLAYYRVIIPQAGDYLKEHGYLMFELGVNQADRVKKMEEEAGFQDVSVVRDFAGIERIIILKKA